MRIGINALYLLPGAVGGTEIYLRQLLQWMPRVAPQHEYLVLVNKESGQEEWAANPGYTVVPTGVRATSRIARLLYEQFRLPALARRYQLDLLFNPGFTAPAWCACPMVTTFHDLQHKRHPEYFKALHRPAWNLFLAIAARRSSRIICVSAASKADFHRFYPAVTAPVDVTPLGASDVCFAIGEERALRATTDDFLLCVSTLHPHKNLHRLVRAFSRWRSNSQASTRLVIAGMRGFYTNELEQVVRQCEATHYVTLTGWIPDAELEGYYRRARAFIFPSLFEGFGIPVVEAMACGLPLAISDREPMRENAGDAAIRFNPTDENDMASAIGKILTEESLRAELSQRARAQASKFRWESTARLTIASLEAANPEATNREATSG